MPIKTCKECGSQIYKDKKSGKFWCPRCKTVREDFEGRYRIVVMGKAAGKRNGRRNFIVCMARELRRLGHEVIELSEDELYKIVPMYDHINCFHNKKPINIKVIEYNHSPDFIYIEQMYQKLDIDEIECPVIYQHREYTHFPDIINPDILLASYHYRLEAFEFYLPWEYHNIPYVDYNFIAVNTDEVKPVEKKTLEGITHIGTSLPFWQFREAGGPFGKMVMDSQTEFWDKCVDEEYCSHIPSELKGKDYIDMMSRCEALLYDAGRLNIFTRRLVEAMAAKTLLVIRVYTKEQENIYKEMGLTDEMCFFVQTPEDVGKIKFTEKERKIMTDKAYDWIIKNHTYKVRAEELLEKFEDFMNGHEKTLKFMGFALKHKIEFAEGKIVID